MRSSQIQSKPQLIRHFQEASKKIFDSSPAISKEQYVKFQEVEKKLLKHEIFPKDYAYGLLTYLEPWVHKKGWRKLPLGIFCSDWARDLYISSIRAVEFTETDPGEMDEGLLLYDELLVARYYIDQSGKMSLDEVVEEIKPALSSDWLNVYTNHKRVKVFSDALEVLSMGAGRPIDDYNELIE